MEINVKLKVYPLNEDSLNKERVKHDYSKFK